MTLVTIVKPALAILLTFLLPFLLLALSSCSPLYVLNASYTEARILASRQDIKENLTSDKLDLPTKEKLALILSVKEFSETIGLTPGGSYTTYSDLKDLPPSYVITAVEAYSLKPLTWWYPFVGRIPYKGYHDKDDALQEVENLKKDGYDLSLRESIAYSTLGWFDDPVLQTVLKQNKADIIITVLHEILHSTLWIQNHPDFNETMAEAVGLVAALEFAKKQMPDEVDSIKKRIRYECETSLNYEVTYNQLDTLFNSNSTHEDKIKGKNAIYAQLDEKISILNKTIWGMDTPTIMKMNFNNASFLGAYIYLKELPTFLSIYIDSEESSQTFVQRLKTINADDPFDSLRKLPTNGMKNTSTEATICEKFN